MTRHPVAYLRRSYVLSDRAKARDGKASREPSREAQEASVKRMAQALEGSEPELFIDWGVSGARIDRREYQRLRQAVEDGRVSTVYAYSLSRLGRNARELLDFFELCKAHDTKVTTEAEGSLSKDTAMGSFLLTIMAAVAELEREMGRERGLAARAIKEERGDHMGPPPYGFRHAVEDGTGRILLVPNPDEPLQPLLDALGDAGSVAGAVRLLNDRGVPAPNGERWHLSAYRRIIDKAMPGHLPAFRRERPNGHRPSVLAGLLRCPCGATLTPNPARAQYYCNRARIVRGHGKATIAEARIIDWVKAEAAKLRYPEEWEVDAEGSAYDDSAQRAALEAMRGIVAEATIDAALADLDAERARHGQRARLVASIPPSLDWSWDVQHINDWLRAAFAYIELGPDLMPVRAEWLVPEWRRTDTEMQRPF